MTDSTTAQVASQLPDEIPAYQSSKSQPSSPNEAAPAPPPVALDPEAIAIVGMACRLSGDVSSLEEFWTMICRKRNGWSEIPEDRFSKGAFWHPNPAKKGSFNPKGGYFIKQDPALFDAPFFNITRAEAEAMDPQQRMLLECTYEALENAGIPKESLAGQKVGVFVGGAAADYRLGTLRDTEQTPMFDATGNHQSIQAGRISHYFDLRGPSFSVDTACSSSLYALHQAVQSIKSGESDQAIVAACHLNLQPGDWVSMSLSRLFSEQGMTFAFDDRAKSGFARGEGVGVIILKSVERATRDNDRIRSVIVSSGVGQDGKTVGITSPSGAAQEALMREVYARAGISPKDVGFVEAHGTGTKVGDPIEATAIHNVFSEGRSRENPLVIGSVKSNVGHCENASGVIAVIKAAMMLDKGFILPQTNFKKPNENIPMKEWNMKVPMHQQPWPTDKQYVSINNFGFGGSNAHCVLAKPPPTPPSKSFLMGQKPRLFLLSANDEVSARSTLLNLSIFLEQHPEVFQRSLLRNLAYTLGQRRSNLSWRIGLVASSASELVAAASAASTQPTRALQHAPRVAFVYTGQGAQWHAMGRELMDAYPIFKATMTAADQCLRDAGADFSLLEELARDKASSRVGEAKISQPACVAIQLALTDLLRSWGITPAAVTGHSSGEVGAAYGAGALTLEQAMIVAHQRGEAVLKMKARYPFLQGAMLAVGAGPEEVAPLIRELREGMAVVACENSPNSVTISGDEAGIDELAKAIEERQLFNRKLRVDVAYHSPHMNLVANDYDASIMGCLETTDETTRDPETDAQVEFYSSLRGAKINHATLDARYWVENLTNTVKFSTALKTMCEENPPDVIVEIGPHAALEGPVKQILKAIGTSTSKIAYFSALNRGQSAVNTALELAAALFTKGARLDMAAINHESERTAATPPTLLDDLRPYPWCRQRYWSESRQSRNHRIKQFPRHDLLGNTADFSNDLAPTWRNVIRTDDLPWLRDHKMQSLTTFPFAGFVSMAIEAAAQRAVLQGKPDFQRFVLREIQVKRPLLMEDGEDYELMTTVAAYAEGTRSYSDEWDEVRILSWEDGKGWTEHCRALMATRNGDGTNAVNSSHSRGTAAQRRIVEAEKLCTEDVDLSVFYGQLDGMGATYGPTFQRLSSIRASETLSIADVDISNVVSDTTATMPEAYQTPYHIHPALLDQVLQLSFPILGAGRAASGGMSTLYMPSFIQELHVQRDGLSTLQPDDKLRVMGSGAPDLASPKATDFSMAAVLPRSSGCLVSLEGLCMTPVKGEAATVDAPRELCFKWQWESASGLSDAEEASASHSETTSDSGYVGSSDQSDKASTIHIVADPGSNSLSEGPKISTDNEATQAWWAKKTMLLLNASAGGEHQEQLLEGLSEIIRVRSAGRAPNTSTVLDVDMARFQDLSKTHLIIFDTEGLLLPNLTAEAFTRLQHLLTNAAGVLWVTSGAYLNATNPSGNMAVGLCRTIRSESEAALATLDLDPDSTLSPEDTKSLILEAFTRAFDPTDLGPDMEYSEQAGSLVVPRIVNDDALNLIVHREVHATSCAPYSQPFTSTRRLKLAYATAGALDSLYFHDDQPLEAPLAANEIEITLRATGMNFKDVVVAMGQLAQAYLGIECAGTVARIGSAVTSLAVGDRVAAMSHGAYSTVARCAATSAARIPDNMAFETAASIPVVYCTAYYGLVDLGRLGAGETVLVHAAAGGVGQAAIQLAKMLGAEVFATVGSADKKKLIMERYGIAEDHIWSSRDASFGAGIRAATSGRGVDVVLNSLAGDLLRESWDCVAHFGRFVEIGKRDISSNTRLEMSKFAYNATFSSVDLSVLADERPARMAATFAEVMRLFEKDAVKPISPISVFGMAQVETAFRLLQSGKTTGKLVVVPQAEELVRATHPLGGEVQQLFRADATYLIVGGTGGLGRSMTKWMVGKGARHVVLVSRSARLEGAVQKLAQDLKDSEDASIVVRACDVTSKESVDKLIGECAAELPPIAGVVHAGMVLRDVLFEKMSFPDYTDVISSKVAGTVNIHNALRTAPLDFFIALSSAAGIVGNRGQAAYAAANTFLDAFMRHRETVLGLPGAVIDLTAVADVGYLADTGAGRQEEVLKNLGGESMNEAEVLALVGAAVSGSMGHNHCMTGLHLGADPAKMPYYAADAKFAHLRQAVLALHGGGSSAASGAQVSIGAALSHAKTEEEAVEITVAGLAGKLSSILMIPADEVDAGTAITKYGLDSLNAIELRNWITKELGVNLQVLQLLTSGSLASLAGTILGKRI